MDACCAATGDGPTKARQSAAAPSKACRPPFCTLVSFMIRVVTPGIRKGTILSGQSSRRSRKPPKSENAQSDPGDREHSRESRARDRNQGERREDGRQAQEERRQAGEAANVHRLTHRRLPHASPGLPRGMRRSPPRSRPESVCDRFAWPEQTRYRTGSYRGDRTRARSTSSVRC